MGQFKWVKALLQVKTEATPQVLQTKNNSTEYEQVEADLERKERNHTWHHLVSKPDNNVHDCSDYKVTINPNLETNTHYQHRRSYAALNGGPNSITYLQIELDEELKKYLTIDTHKDLYQENRLPYGVASSPANFQQTMVQILPKLPGVVCFLDNILVSGCTEVDHLSNLEAVPQKLQEYGLRLKQWNASSFRSLLNTLDKNSSFQQEDQGCSQAKTSNRCFRVKIFHFYYGKLAKFLAYLRAPINHLLRKDKPWKWSGECQQSFDEIKEALTWTKVLAYYDSKLLVGLACDASVIGVVAVFHRYEDGTKDQSPMPQRV